VAQNVGRGLKALAGYHRGICSTCHSACQALLCMALFTTTCATNSREQ
jgi:hypothetical protein